MACGEKIESPKGNQIYHPGDCQSIGVERRYASKRAKLKKERKMVVRRCECGTEFKVSETNLKRVYCQGEQCTYDRKRKQLEARAAAGTLPKKIKKSQSGDNRKAIGISYETIVATCPACRDTHEQRVVKGSSKWIYCSQHEKYRYADLSRKEGNRISFATMRDY
jgi:hypothetical protein